MHPARKTRKQPCWSVAVTEVHYAHLLKEDLVAASQQVKIPIAPRSGGRIVSMNRQTRNG